MSEDSREDGRGTGRPARLSRTVIVQTAIDLADRRGLEAVTMRAVAAELGSVAAALYRHVKNREQLVDCVRDEVLAERPEVSPTGDRRADLTAFALGLLAVHEAHPWLSTGGLPSRLGPRTQAALVEAVALVENHPAGTGQKHSAVAVLFELVAGFARSGAAARSLTAESPANEPASPPETVGRDHAITVILAAVTGVLDAEGLD